VTTWEPVQSRVITARNNLTIMDSQLAQTAQPSGTGSTGGFYVKNADGTYAPIADSFGNLLGGSIAYVANCVTSAPGLEVDPAAPHPLTVENANTFFIRQGALGTRSISYLVASTVFPTLTGGDLAFDNGSQPVTTPSCRIYTFFASVDPVTAAVTLSVLYGADFPKHRPARTTDFNLGDGTKAIVGYLYVKNESSAVFIPGTTTLNASGITASPSDQIGFIPVAN